MSKSKKKAKPIVNTNDPLNPNISVFFKWYRARRGYSQRDLAAVLDINQSYIAKVEKGTEVFPYSVCLVLYKKCDIEEKKYLFDCMTGQLKQLLV